MKKLIIFFILFSITFVSCDPCEEVDCPNPFTNEELLWLPYNLFEKIVLMDPITFDSVIYSVDYIQQKKMEPIDHIAPNCQTACYYLYNLTGNRKFSNNSEEQFVFSMNKTTSKFNIIKQSGFISEYEFNLSEAVILDSVLINGNYIYDVYEYSCQSDQELVAKTYMHQGKGLVKITLRDGQQFELIEHGIVN